MAARNIDRLTARKVETLTKPGVYIDGEGLRLVVDATGGKRWRFRYRFDGKDRELGLGGYRARAGAPAVTLAMAREKARKAREHVRAGRDPLEQERAETRIPTFGEAADAFIEAQSPSWRNPVHHAQWTMTLRDYAAPIREKRVDRIDTADVLKVLKPVWQSKPETASRLRGRIERVLAAAKAEGHRSGENPAAWRGHLDHLLPARQKLTRGHHAALAFGDLPAFVATLREQDTVAALALEFVILTAARSGEVIGARWCEIDPDAKVWTVPAERMKAGAVHRVPLSARALAILETARAFGGEYVFPGARPGKPLSGMAMAMMLRRMKVGATVHGFRSSFRDWAGEASTFPREVAEAALAHSVGDQTERAYRRGDALEKRRLMMEAWATFCETRAAGNVVAMQRAG